MNYVSYKNVLLRVGSRTGWYLSISLSRTFKGESLCLAFEMSALLREGGGIGHHLLVALSRHSEKYALMFCLGVIL